MKLKSIEQFLEEKYGKVYEQINDEDIEIIYTEFSTHGGFAGEEEDKIRRTISEHEVKQIIKWLFNRTRNGGKFNVYFSQGFKSGAVQKKFPVTRYFDIKINDSVIEVWDAVEKGGGTKKLGFGNSIYPGGNRYKDLNLSKLVIKRIKS